MPPGAAVRYWRSRHRSRTRLPAAGGSYAGRLLASTNRQLQAVRRGRERTLVSVVVRAVRVVGAIEVDRVDAGHGWMEIQVASRGVGFGPRRLIGEGHEERLDAARALFHEGCQRHRLAVQDKLEHPDALHPPQ